MWYNAIIKHFSGHRIVSLAYMYMLIDSPQLCSNINFASPTRNILKLVSVYTFIAGKGFSIPYQKYYISEVIDTSSMIC